MFAIIQRRYWYFGLSLLIIVPGLIALAIWGLPLAIDFTGGTVLEVQFTEASKAIDLAEVRQVYTRSGLADVSIQLSRSPQSSGNDIIIARSAALSESQKQTLQAGLQELYGPYTLLSAETVGPSVGAEVATRAAGAVGLAALGILAYVWFAFRKLEHAFRYAVCAIIAMLHDVLLLIGVTAIFGKVFGWQVDSLFITALLTVVGFSVHDTIVVFDRVRENLRLYRRLDYETVVNHSIVQTLDRSINTQLTVMFTLVALALFGGETTRHFVITLLIGLLSGTYSSIFNAAALLVVWEKREWQHWFRRNNAPVTA